MYEIKFNIREIKKSIPVEKHIIAIRKVVKKKENVENAEKHMVNKKVWHNDNRNVSQRNTCR